jgi:organic hydroperoxide reductase OsmC/OhrA
MADGSRVHTYHVNVEWTGNRGAGTVSYRGYGREHVISAPGKPSIPGSSDPSFLGDAARWNPEETLVASLSTCHQLWYLHLCAEAGVIVTGYVDAAVGEMEERGSQGGRFVSVTLHPKVTIKAGCDAVMAADLHHDAHVKCFVANSVNFPVLCHPQIVSA